MPHLSNNWNFEKSTHVYKYLNIHKDWIGIKVKPNYEYEIGFERVGTAKEVCQWLAQIADKTWCSPELLGELVIAFSRINGNLHMMS